MRIRLNQQIRSYNNYANFRVWLRICSIVFRACNQLTMQCHRLAILNATWLNLFNIFLLDCSEYSLYQTPTNISHIHTCEVACCTSFEWENILYILYSIHNIYLLWIPNRSMSFYAYITYGTIHYHSYIYSLT